MSAVSRIVNAANKNHGVTLQPYEVRELAGMMVNVDAELDRLYALEELLEGEVVDADVVEEGQIQEKDGVDPQ